MLATVVPDVHLVATLMSLSRVIPEKNKEMARQVVRKVVEELLRQTVGPYATGGNRCFEPFAAVAGSRVTMR